ncbi:MAG: permease, partial [Ferroplasma sp. Type II]
TFSAVYAAGGGGTLATEMSKLPPTEAIFGALLGINPAKVILGLLPASAISSIPHSAIVTMTARTWFPTIFAPAFMKSLHIVFYAGAAIVFVGAIISIFREPLKKSRAEKVDKPSTIDNSELSDKAVKMKR